ncbi:nickel-dependent hydrogenase large subunit [Escherichia coli]
MFHQPGTLRPRNFNDDVWVAYQQSLVTPVADPNKPLEVVRTIHSFDPSSACAVHVVDADGNEVVS